MDHLGHSILDNNVSSPSTLLYQQTSTYTLNQGENNLIQITQIPNVYQGPGLYKVRVSGVLPLTSSLISFRVGLDAGSREISQLLLPCVLSYPHVAGGEPYNFTYSCDLLYTPTYTSWQQAADLSFWGTSSGDLTGATLVSNKNSGASITPPGDLNVYISQLSLTDKTLSVFHCTVEYQT